jgi:hypothetical protein
MDGDRCRYSGTTGERGRIRTCDPCLKRALLYHLSYAPTFSKTLVYQFWRGILLLRSLHTGPDALTRVSGFFIAATL